MSMYWTILATGPSDLVLLVTLKAEYDKVAC